MRLEVALIADPEDPFGAMAGDDWHTPYSQRRRVAFDVDGSVSLAEALEEAARRLEIAPPPGSPFSSFRAAHNRVTFYRPEDEVGVARKVWQLGEMALVDRHGRALFGVHDKRTVTFDQLVRSGAAGVLDGDPLRPYLIVEAPYGDGPPIDLPTLLDGVELTVEFLEPIATVGGALAFGQMVISRVRDRLHRGAKAARGAGPDLLQRLARMDQLERVLLLRPWTADELALLLDCDPDQARGLVGLLGWVEDSDGHLVLQDDQESALQSMLLQALGVAARRGLEIGPEVEHAVHHVLQHADLPTVEFEADEPFGPGAERILRRRARGEDEAEGLMLRAFCRWSRRPPEEVIASIAEASGFRVASVTRMPAPWSRLELEHPASGDLIVIEAVIDDGDSEALFSIELREFAEATTFINDEVKHSLLEHLYSSRMVVSVELPQSDNNASAELATALFRLCANTGQGLAHVEGEGWLIDDGCVELPY